MNLGKGYLLKGKGVQLKGRMEWKADGRGWGRNELLVILKKLTVR